METDYGYFNKITLMHVHMVLIVFCLLKRLNSWHILEYAG